MSLRIATSESLSLCECKIARALKRLCAILDRSQILTGFAKEKDLLGVALLAAVVGTFFNGDYIINDNTF